MSDVREIAIEALLRRRGLAGIFGRPEAVGDVQAIEAVVDLVAHGSGEPCARCEAIDNALDDPETRLYRTAEGSLIVASPEADPDEVAERVEQERAVELVPARAEPVTFEGERPIRERTAGSLRITAEYDPLRAVPAGPDYSAADEPVAVVCDLGSHERCSGARCACGCHDEQRAAR